MTNVKPITIRRERMPSLLDGRMTQIRMVLNPQPTVKGNLMRLAGEEGYSQIVPTNPDVTSVANKMRYKTGDLLWVREAWRAETHFNKLAPREIPPGSNVQYQADALMPWDSRARPGMFMPRWAARITLEVTDVRVQRLQDISEEDAKAEGVDRYPVFEDDQPTAYYDAGFAVLWNTIHGPCAWEANPWVAAYTFKVYYQNVDALLEERASA